MYTADNALRVWDMEEFDPNTHDDFWKTINALPLGSVIATGFIEDGLVFFEKIEDDWKIVQVDNDNVVDDEFFAIGSLTGGDSAMIDAGGDIEVAYIVKGA